MSPLRRQLPVYSPVTARSLASGLLDALRPGSDPRHRLRRLLEDEYDAHRALLYGSGTHALTAALRAAAEATAPDRTVALPGYTCYDVATAAVGADCRIALYDLDPDTLAPDWASVEAALQAGARVLVLAPLYGFPFHWTAAEELARTYEAILIEDAAQGAGGAWDGKPAGAFGRLSVLSFGRGKGWTGGKGGALMSRGPGLPAIPAEPAPRGGLPAFVTAFALLALARPALFGLPHALPWLRLGETHYREPEPEQGMTRIAAALVLASHDLVREEVPVRRHCADALSSALQEIPDLRPIQHAPPADPGFLRLPYRLLGSPIEGQHGRRLGRLGVERGYPTTLARLEPVRRRLVGNTPPHLPGAEALAASLITLPTHTRVTAADRSALIFALGGKTGSLRP